MFKSIYYYYNKFTLSMICDLLSCRTDGDPKVYQITFPDFVKLQGIQICESYGNESLLDMVTRKFQKVSFKSYKPKLEKMLFLDDDKICLNVGRPAGELSTDKKYTCLFKKTCALCLSNYRREYAVEEYNGNWELRNFFVTFSLKSFSVSPFAKLVGNKIQVDFFRGATIFEALVRDKRFYEKNLRYCTFACEGATLIELSVKADNFQGKCIEIRLGQDEDKDLPKFVPPRKRPRQDPAVINGEVKDEPRKSTQDLHPATCTAGPSTETPSTSSTPSIRDKSTENLTHLIECAFEIKSRKLTPTAKQKLVQRCNKIFRNFALAENISIFVSQSEDLNEIAKSVGAVFMVKDAGSPFLVGTCFRIGVQYVITNKHVWDILSEGPPEMIFIDFAFKKGEVPNPFGRRYVPENFLVSSSSCVELDYAILQLREPPQELPPCIFTAGVTIMDPTKNPHSMLHGQNLRLIGHPRGQPKKIDPICPVSTIPQDGAAYHSYAIRREITDQRRETYHVSDFYRGSSGSPGILFQNDKKYLAVLHTKGFSLEDPNRSTIEQGVLFTEIVKHVLESIENAHQDSSSDNILKYKTLADIFPSIESWPELMDIDEYM